MPERDTGCERTDCMNTDAKRERTSCVSRGTEHEETSCVNSDTEHERTSCVNGNTEHERTSCDRSVTITLPTTVTALPSVEGIAWLEHLRAPLRQPEVQSAQPITVTERPRVAPWRPCSRSPAHLVATVMDLG